MRAVATQIKVADEVFIATALLHREHPERDSFPVNEIVERAEKLDLAGQLRPGVRVHAALHCVANKPPNPARLRMLYATPNGNRRLLRAGDEVHPERTGKIWPDPEEVPEHYRGLIDWAKQQYGSEEPRKTPWLDGILQMHGIGRELWKGEDPDEYVRQLREGWE